MPGTGRQGHRRKGPKTHWVVRGESKPWPRASVSESPHASLSHTQSRRLGRGGEQIPAEYRRWLRESGGLVAWGGRGEVSSEAREGGGMWALREQRPQVPPEGELAVLWVAALCPCNKRRN